MEEPGALGGRRTLAEAEARDKLREGVIQRFRDDRRYQNIVRQDLSPRWKTTLATGLWTGNPPLTIDDVLDRLDGDPVTGSPSTLALQRYVQVLTKTVGHTMGLTAHGLPPTWALRRVHDDVIGRPRRSSLLTTSPRLTDDDLSLSLDMTPNAIASRFFGGVGATETRSQDYDFSRIGVGYGTEHWTALGQTAYLVIDQAITHMRQVIEHRYPARNSAAIDGWERDLDLLLGVLFHHERPASRALEVRLRRLCERLEIDSPLGRRPGHLAPYAGTLAAEDQSASAAS